jgi:hypothetical protein
MKFIVAVAIFCSFFQPPQSKQCSSCSITGYFSRPFTNTIVPQSFELHRGGFFRISPGHRTTERKRHGVGNIKISSSSAKVKLLKAEILYLKYNNSIINNNMKCITTSVVSGATGISTKGLSKI